MDLFSNPMVESAKKALTQEQKEEYKKIGDYLYNSDNYKNLEMGSKIKESSFEEILQYATEMLKAGGDPFDLSQKEIESLYKFYGEKWYDHFNLEESEIPKLNPGIIQFPVCRQQIRALKRKNEKKKRFKTQ